MECCRYLVFLIEQLYGAFLTVPAYFMAIYLFNYRDSGIIV